MKDFIFRMPTKIRFGENSSQQIGAVLKEMNYKKAFIATGKHVNKAGIAARVAESIEKAGLEYVICDEFIPEPTVESVDHIAEILRQSGADVVVAVGGGSPIDAAKASRPMKVPAGTISSGVRKLFPDRLCLWSQFPQQPVPEVN